MKNKKLILAEITLIIGSVFIFRSLWMLFDRIPFMSKDIVLWLSLFIGLAICVWAMYCIAGKNEQNA